MLIALLLYFKVPKELLCVRKQFIFLYIFMPFLESSSLFLYTYKKINVNIFFLFLKDWFLGNPDMFYFLQKKNWNYVKKIYLNQNIWNQKKKLNLILNTLQHQKLCCAVDHPTTLLYTYQTFLFVFFCTYVCVNLT